MKKIIISVLVVFTLFLNSCALTGGTQTSYGNNKPCPSSSYGANIKLPEHGNYTTSSKVQVVPLPTATYPELSTEDTSKTFYLPYSELFTASLKSVKALNLNLETFNSSKGTIQFKNIQGDTLYLTVKKSPDSNSRSTITINDINGSRKIDKNLVNVLFKAINDIITGQR